MQDLADTHYNMGVMFSKKRNYGRAAKEFRQVIDPHPLVHPELLAATEAAFNREEQEWELEQIEVIKVGGGKQVGVCVHCAQGRHTGGC